jgi:hypothetical protein
MICGYKYFHHLLTKKSRRATYFTLKIDEMSKTEGRRPETEDRRPKMEDGSPEPEDGK